MRGAESKAKVTKKILYMFDDSFVFNKEIRIPMVENGEELQIKVTLTAAKNSVPNPNKTAETAATNQGEEQPQPQLEQPSPQELANLEKLLSELF